MLLTMVVAYLAKKQKGISIMLLSMIAMRRTDTIFLTCEQQESLNRFDGG